MRYVLAVFFLLSSVCVSSSASAASFGCESVGGSVIFKDTLYGALTGTVLSGLVLLASDAGEDSGQIIAGGTAVGGLLGLGLGIAEVSLRECPPMGFSQKEGLQGSFAALRTPTGGIGSGIRLAWNF